MIPILFESTYPNTSRTFSGHGIGDLIDATEVLAEENAEDGHEWELTFNYPVTGELFNEITLERIVLAKVNTYQPPQAFRIYSITKNINQTISVACQHISYDLANIPVKPMKSVGAGPALVDLKTNMLNVCNRDNFIFSTNLPTPSTPSSEAERKDVTVEFEEPRNALKVLFDGDESIHGKYGGDVIVDNYDISLLSIGGEDREVSIEYGIDLVDLDQERNISNMVTGILPYYIRAKDTKLEAGIERSNNITDSDSDMVLTTEGYTLKVGCKYTVTIGTENSNGSSKITSASGFGEQTFVMDGKEHKFDFVPQSTIVINPNTVLVQSVTVSSDVDLNYIRSFDITENYVEPIIYGDLTNGQGVYNVPKIEPVDLTEYFQDSNDEPTVAQINAKAAEWVDKEEIGQPEVSLTVSYASLEGKDIRLHDAVRVRFVQMGIDVKSKVTRYKYDVLNERCTEIDVGKTKDSAIFTLQDASRLRKGLLPPDRIGKDSINGNKIKKGSIGKDQLGAGVVTKWNMDPDDFSGLDEKIGTEDLKIDDGTLPDGWHKDPILKTVPNNVYGGYHKDVGYLFDPSMGVPPDNLFGWTYRNATTGDETFHPITKWQQNIPYDEHGSGVGYVLDPNIILDKDIDASKKITNGTVTNDQIANTTLDKDKFNTRTRNEWDDIAQKTANFGHLIGPQMAIDVQSDYYAIEKLTATSMQAAYYQIDGLTGYLVFPQQTGNTAYNTHAIYNTSSATPIGYFISNTDITLPPNLSSDISRLDTHYQGLAEIVWAHEARISALEGN